MSSEEFFIKFRHQPEQLQTELIRIMGEYVNSLTIDDINDFLLNTNDCCVLKSTIKKMTENEKKQIKTFFNKCGILLRINDIFLYQMQVNTMEMALNDVQIISKLIDQQYVLTKRSRTTNLTEFHMFIFTNASSNIQTLTILKIFLIHCLSRQKAKSKGNTISLKLGGNEGNEDKRTKNFKSESDRLLPDFN